MKLYVLSDTHGNKFNMDIFIKRAADADCIVHLGDLVTDARYIASKVQCSVQFVKGNCDFGMEPTELIMEFENGKVLLTHGHQQGVKSGLDRLIYKSLEAKVNLTLFGHTHISMIEYTDGIFLVNPGSLSMPKNTEKPTYAYIELDGNKIKPALCSLY